ncbi:MAG: methyl-accepting chemotaxis protein [Brevinematia bacterium]
MRKPKIGFAFKSSLAVSLVVLSISFVVTYFVLDFLYSLIQTRIINTLKVINKGFKEDYYDYEVLAIREYGEKIISENLDEYENFVDVIEPSLIGFAEDYDIWQTKSPEEFSEFVAGVFYWDGSVVHSRDPSFQDSKFIEFLKKLNLRVGEEDVYIDYERSSGTYLFKLRKGVIGCRVYPEIYNRVWLRSILKEAKIDFYGAISPKNGDLRTNFFEIINEVDEVGIKPEEVYGDLIRKVKNKSFDIVGGVKGGFMEFLIVHDYGQFIFNGVIEVPLRYILPIGIVEMSILVSLPIVLVLFILVLFFTNRVIGRIRALSEKMAELGRSGGDLSYRIEMEVGVREVREVAENINEFLSTVEDIVRRSKGTFKDAEENMRFLSELGDEVVRIKEIVAEQGEVRQMMEEISAMSSEIGTIVEEMLRSFEGIRSNIERQYSMIEEMSGMVEETIMTVNNIGKRVGKVNEVLLSLRDEALRSSAIVRKNVEEVRDVDMFLKNVLEVVDVIKGISSKIEVLSMNAGIEAAHAGEAGRGFAVVAEEMGNLAEDSRRRAVEIERMVRDVITKVKEGMEGVEENGERFVRIAEGVKEVSVFVSEINASMIEVEKTNKVVMGVISNLASYSESIKVAMVEGKSGMEEIVKAVYEVNDATNSLNESFGKVYSVMTNAVDILGRASEKLPIIVNSIKTLSVELNKFKVKEIGSAKGITLAE